MKKTGHYTVTEKNKYYNGKKLIGIFRFPCMTNKQLKSFKKIAKEYIKKLET